MNLLFLAAMSAFAERNKTLILFRPVEDENSIIECLHKTTVAYLDIIMSRLDKLTSFLVMDIVRQARALPDAIHFEIGEPDIAPSPHVLEAIAEATRKAQVQYTESLGLLALREKIAAFYQERYGVSVSPQRIALTVGTSGAFLITYAALLNAGERLLLTDPSYPCYKNFAYVLDAQPVFVPIDASTRYQLTVEQAQWAVREHPGIKALQISSPANPIGNLYDADNLRDLMAFCEQQEMYFISDEIYHGLVYDRPAHTALEYSDRAIVINSFSKYFCLPGLRLGWVILPEDLMRKAEMLLQNLYIAAPTLSQYGALAAFDEAHLQQVTATYRARRDYLYEALSQLFTIDAKPEGAFYIWADISRYAEDSQAFAQRLLQETHVATTPGIDFGQHQAHRYLRFAYTRELPHLQQGVARLQAYLKPSRRFALRGLSR